MSAGSAIEKLLDKIDSDLSDFLVFAGILDNNAKLLSYRVGKSSFSLPIERHDTLDVQIALMFSLIKQLEDISGAHKLSVTRFAKHDIFMFGNQDLHIFVITSPTSEERVAKSLVDLVSTISSSTTNLENAITKATAGLPNPRKEQTVAAAMATPKQQSQVEQGSIDRHGLVLHRSRPEAITMLQGYLMGVEPPRQVKVMCWSPVPYSHRSRSAGCKSCQGVSSMLPGSRPRSRSTVAATPGKICRRQQPMSFPGPTNSTHPWRNDSRSSGIRRPGSTEYNSPSPSHVAHMPCGLLKLNSCGLGGWKLIPQWVQA